MGQVCQATDTTLKRQAAIKILPTSVAADHDRHAGGTPTPGLATTRDGRSAMLSPVARHSAAACHCGTRRVRRIAGRALSTSSITVSPISVALTGCVRKVVRSLSENSIARRKCSSSG